MGKQAIKPSNKVRTTIDKLTRPLQSFIRLEASSGIFLFVVAVIAMFFANSRLLQDFYFNFINLPVSISVGGLVLNKTLLLLVNDGLMAIFFFLVGLEIKRELLIGELATPRKAAFSFFAAVGGMFVPALIYVFMNIGTDSIKGWGIPMATDIAFALGVVTLLGKRVPTSIKIFLLSLAIVDDLGAILIIALFYSGEIASQYLGFASIFLLLLFILNHSGYRNIAVAMIIGFIVWFCFLKSGVHATLAGVILAFLTPARASGVTDGDLLIDHYIHALHPWIAFLIMPIFAFFNAGVNLAGVDFSLVLSSSVGSGIILGLVAGKPLGVFLFTYIPAKLGWCELPENTNWMQIVSVGFIAGIGFTMSLFISSLAFKGDSVEAYSKVAIITGSLISMLAGYLLLRLSSPIKKH